MTRHTSLRRASYPRLPLSAPDTVRPATKNQGSLFGSDSMLVQRSGFSWCAEQAGTDQIELGPAVHLALDQLQLGVLSFCLSVRPWLDKRGLYCGAIIDDAGRE